ncbi:hypothetical protein GCM10007385_44930 [Tateyamaria omphalii]|uniref:GNAT family N-acetyltransferase n=1 Tax=Tateyamaria omphalii TaxID=299262 RepID=UPI001679C50F|nr:GNAT family protein [Tateyamaria omphalii]GGX70944.1 hypothetical protein GCM10007385_44930 [Tateyamaria omphalii]
MGFAYLVGMWEKNQAVELRQLAVQTPGQGHGGFLLSAVRREVLENRQKNQLWLDVFSENTQTRNLYQKNGFVEEGLLRQAYLWKGGFQSTVIMSVLAQEL